MSAVEHSPLDAVHRHLGAKMVPFGGWEMPSGLPSRHVDEHLACRRRRRRLRRVHLGTVRVEGADAAASCCSRRFTNDLHKIAPGRAQYTHLLDEADASVLDDIIVWWVDDDVFDVMPNASNTDRVRAAIGGNETTHDARRPRRAGPHGQGAPGGRCSPRLPRSVASGSQSLDWQGVPCVVAGTGYTGEAGVEIAVPNASAADLWEAIVAAGVTPAGLGARDTLRLEAGLPLHGHELGPGITSLQAGLGWVVAWSKPAFRGRRSTRGRTLGRVSRAAHGHRHRGPPATAAECAVAIDGHNVGEVTSGNFSPVLEHGIALAFLPPDTAVGTEVSVDVRGTALAGRVVTDPVRRQALISASSLRPSWQRPSWQEPSSPLSSWLLPSLEAPSLLRLWFDDGRSGRDRRRTRFRCAGAQGGQRGGNPNIVPADSAI